MKSVKHKLAPGALHQLGLVPAARVCNKLYYCLGGPEEAIIHRVYLFLLFPGLKSPQKRIREILNLSTCADNSTDTKTYRNGQKRKTKM